MASIMSELPTVYELEYMVYSLSVSMSDEEKIWRTPYLDVIRRTMFNKFDNYVEKRFYDLKEKR